MAKGRPRSKALRPRKTNGKIKYPQNKNKTEKQIKATALKGRLKYAKPHHAKRVESSSLFGMLLLEGYLTQQQYDASQRYIETIDKYRRMQGLGVEHIRAVALGTTIGVSKEFEDSPEYIEKIKAEYLDSMNLTMSILNNITIDGYYKTFKEIICQQVTLAASWLQYTNIYELKNITARLDRLIIFYKIK